MDENVRGSSGRGFLIFALGTAVGAAVALLTAPRTGKETRRRLQKALQQAKEKAGDISASVAESYAQGTEALRTGVMKAFDKDPEHASGAQGGIRPATGTAPKSGLSSH